MPRSGTTLVEQIISSHPSVFGGDEVNFLPNIVKKYFVSKNSGILFDNISIIKQDVLNNIGCEYVEELRKLTSGSKRITDKLPVNFKWIGLIKLILPNSKIIHCTRNSKDICLSIFKNYFVSRELKYAYVQSGQKNFS